MKSKEPRRRRKRGEQRCVHLTIGPPQSGKSHRLFVEGAAATIGGLDVRYWDGKYGTEPFSVMTQSLLTHPPVNGVVILDPIDALYTRGPWAVANPREHIEEVVRLAVDGGYSVLMSASLPAPQLEGILPHVATMTLGKDLFGASMLPNTERFLGNWLGGKVAATIPTGPAATAPNYAMLVVEDTGDAGWIPPETATISDLVDGLGGFTKQDIQALCQPWTNTIVRSTARRPMPLDRIREIVAWANVEGVPTERKVLLARAGYLPSQAKDIEASVMSNEDLLRLWGYYD